MHGYNPPRYNEYVKEIYYKQMIITTSAPNNMVILNDNTILKVRKILGNSNNPEILQIEGII